MLNVETPLSAMVKATYVYISYLVSSMTIKALLKKGIGNIWESVWCLPVHPFPKIFNITYHEIEYLFDFIQATTIYFKFVHGNKYKTYIYLHTWVYIWRES